MAKSKIQKEAEVKKLADKLAKTKAMVFANFDGLKVSEINSLRSECRQNEVDYVVAKKTLLKIALADAAIKDVDPKTVDGGVATVMSYGDEVTPAKILSKFAKDHGALKIIGGVLEHKFVDGAVIASLAKLPSRDELIAKVVGSIAAPLSGIVGVLQGNLRNLVGVLAAIKDSKK